MAAVTLPLTFQNSFWSQDYRTGLEVLFAQLEKVRMFSPFDRRSAHLYHASLRQGIIENDEIVAFIKVRTAIFLLRELSHVQHCRREQPRKPLSRLL